MATLSDLQQLTTDLKSYVQAKNNFIALSIAKISALSAQIDEFNNEIMQAGSAVDTDDIQSIVDKLNATRLQIGD